MYTPCYLRESQIDWLTVGAHTRAHVDALSTLASGLVAAEQADGNKPRPWRLLGYEGERCGRVRFGVARGWALMQLSGDSARAWFLSAMQCADSVSRIDLAVTIATDEPDPNTGRILYEQARAWRVDHPKAARPWYIGGDGNGWTTYIGQRQSDAFFRCYDKAAEQRDAGDESGLRQYENAWRYEVEFKADAAAAISARLVAASNVSGSVNAMVYRWLADRGIEPPWTPEQPVRPLGSFRRRSDRDRKLNWLLTQVRPTVQWLIENGDSNEVLTRLGLDLACGAVDSTL